ncbi:MAG: hypothetical protein WCK39_10325, partial [Methanomassiliicoccales archaeon]
PTEIASWTRQTVSRAVTDLSVMAGDAQVILTWSAPSEPSVDHCVAFMDGVEARRVTGTNVTVDHLVNGMTYSFNEAALLASPPARGR